MAPSRRKFMFVLLIIGVCGVLVIGIGELGVRLFVKNGFVTPGVLQRRSVQYEPAVFARHVFKQEARRVENLLGSKKGVIWEINEKGYRGPNFEEKKPNGVIRIIVYGGSAAFDIMMSGEDDWPHQVERKLRKAGFPNVEVINAGIMGHTALESVGRLLTEGFVFEPDYVVIYNAWNDIKYMTSPRTVLRTLKPSLQKFDPRIHYHNGVDRWLCETSHLYTILRRTYYKMSFNIDLEGLLTDDEKTSDASTLNPTGFEQYRLAMETFVNLAASIKARPILVTQARLVHASNTSAQKDRIKYHHVGLTHEALVKVFDRLDEIVRMVASEKGVLLIDASAQLSGKDWAFHDHVHFDLEGKGSQAMAHLIAGHLQDLLAAEQGKQKVR